MPSKKSMADRLKRLRDGAVSCVERAMREVKSAGEVDTGKLRHLIQSIKDLKDIAIKDDNEPKVTSKLFEALEREDDTEQD